MNDWLFVYGTLRRASRHPMARFLAENAEWFGFADFQGMLFNIGSYPGAVPSADPAHRVRGEIYRLYNPDTILPQIDQYEEFGKEFSEPNEFIRTQQDVWFEGVPSKPWIYLYNHSTDTLELSGSDYFLPS